MKIFKKKSSVADLGTVTRKPRPFIKRIGRDPHVDWLLSVLAAFIVAVVLVFVGASEYLYFDSKLEDQISATKVVDTASIDTKSLDSVLLRYEQRALEREGFIRTYIGPNDPSL